MDSYYVCKKSGSGEYYKNCKGERIRFLYKVFCCRTYCDPVQCRKCHQMEEYTPVEEGMADFILGDGSLHTFIENVLLNSSIRRGSALTFVLSSKDAFEDIGVPNKIPPNTNICCHLEEPAI